MLFQPSEHSLLVCVLCRVNLLIVCIVIPLIDIEHKYAMMEQSASARYVSLHTRLRSFVFHHTSLVFPQIGIRGKSMAARGAQVLLFRSERLKGDITVAIVFI